MPQFSFPVRKIVNKNEDAPPFGKGQVTHIFLMLGDVPKFILSSKVLLAKKIS